MSDITRRPDIDRQALLSRLDLIAQVLEQHVGKPKGFRYRLAYWRWWTYYAVKHSWIVGALRDGFR